MLKSSRVTKARFRGYIRPTIVEVELGNNNVLARKHQIIPVGIGIRCSVRDRGASVQIVPSPQTR